MIEIRINFELLNIATPWYQNLLWYLPMLLGMFVSVLASILITLNLTLNKKQHTTERIARKIKNGKILILIGFLFVLADLIRYLIYTIRYFLNEIFQRYSIPFAWNLMEHDLLVRISTSIGILGLAIFTFSGYNFLGTNWGGKGRNNLLFILFLQTFYNLIFAYMLESRGEYDDVATIVLSIMLVFYFASFIFINILFKILKVIYGYNLKTIKSDYLLIPAFIFLLTTGILSLTDVIPYSLGKILCSSAIIFAVTVQIITIIELLIKGRNIKHDVLKLEESANEPKVDY